MGYRVRMEVVLMAIRETVTTEKGKALMDFRPVVGISADLAYEVIVTCESLRHGAGDAGTEDLYALARQAAYERSIPFPRKRAYHLIAMAYYRIIKRFVRNVREKRAAMVALRTQQVAAHNQQRLAESVSL